MGRETLKKQVAHTVRATLERVLFILSHLVPRSKKIWVCIGWHKGEHMEIFADNAKYLYLHVANEHPEIQAIWLAKDEALAKVLRQHGYHAYEEHSLLGMWYALRAGTTVIDAYLQPHNFCFSGGTRLVQLLHGKGMKKGGYKEAPRRTQNIIFSTSPFVSSMLPDTFVQNTRCVDAGYSRGDVLFKKIKGSEIGVDIKTLQLLQDTSYEKRLWYAPTFRRGAHTADLSVSINLPHLSKWLVERNYLMVLSLHPKYAEQVRALSYPNIHFLEDSDVYPLFPFFDVLITDYSSLFTDFLLLDKPLVFYPYDLQTYKEKEGLSFDDYDAYTPGPKACSFNELLEVTEKILQNDTYKGDRARVRDLYHTHQDGDSSKRIMTALQQPSKEVR